MDCNLEVQIKSLLFSNIGVLKLLAYHLQIHHFHNVQRDTSTVFSKYIDVLKVTIPAFDVSSQFCLSRRI
jgi:hypothetical protein